MPSVAYHEDGDGDRVLTAEQVCEQLGISRETFRKLVKSGDLRAMKTGPQAKAHWRVSEEAVADYIRRRTDSASAS